MYTVHIEKLILNVPFVYYCSLPKIIHKKVTAFSAQPSGIGFLLGL